jgi:ABC-type phosphate transport system auxiliary subunit
MSGTIGEMQMTLINIQSNLQTVVNSQQTLSQRINHLETKLSEIQTNANQHLANLTHQFNSLRLTHTREKEKKEIAYHNPPLEDQNQEY